MKKKEICILLIDDKPYIHKILNYYLSSEGFKVITAENGMMGIELAREKIPHLIILDVIMPEMDGIETCKQLRKIPELNGTIITFLTASSEDCSEMAGLDSGADNYIIIPIKPKVLISKVKALLRRFKEKETPISVVKLGNLVINREEYIITKGKTNFDLPRKEFELLSLLASRPGQVFQRDEILKKIWGTEVVGGGSIEVLIKKLRDKVGREKIETIKGRGYKIIP